MKTLRNFCYLLLLISFVNCSVEEPEPEGDPHNSGGDNIYTLTFWSDFQGAPIEVYVNGDYEGEITGIHDSNPGCDASRSVSVKFSSSGSVSYYATDGDYTWEREIEISGSCTTVLLTN